MSDAPKCSSESTPKARKRHKCCECRGWIEIGETYHVFSGVWDDPATFKTCSDCQALRDRIDAALFADYEEASIFGALAEELEDDEKREFVAIMQKRGAVIHPSWAKYLEAKP